jgi:hypothetical protein
MRRRRMLAVWMDQNFAGRSRPEQGHAVGNAVPPLMAKVIGRAYVKHAVALARGRRQSLNGGNQE